MISTFSAARPLKIRDEADPYSFEIGVTEEGDIVKVLEVRRKCKNILSRRLKIHEQADPYSMEVGTTEAGDTVKVLEVRFKMWFSVCFFSLVLRQTCNNANLIDSCCGRRSPALSCSSIL